MLRSFLLSFAALCLLPAAAAANDLADAIENSDLPALHARMAAGGEEGVLARGVAAALMRDDAAALAALTASAASSLAPELRRAAHLTLSGLYFRQSRFAEAAASMEAAAALGVEPDPERAAANVQSLVFARALAGAPSMTFAIAPQGEVRIERDMAQLPRAQVAINGASEIAILDTGAGYSTISQSTAERHGLRFLDAQVTVSSSTSDSVPTRLAFAQTVTLAGGEFRDVLFAVLPDEALTFADGAYTIDAIIGLPLLAQLGRTAFVETPDGEVFRHARSPFARGPESNLMLDGLQPIVVVQAGGADLTMLLDTGARRSHLSPEAIEKHPALAHGGATQSTTYGGAGAVRTEDALTIPRLALTVEGYPVTLENITVLDHPGRDGMVGQDLMRAGSGYVIDFDAMRFEIIP